jgi:hypothetical protein
MTVFRIKRKQWCIKIVICVVLTLLWGPYALPLNAQTKSQCEYCQEQIVTHSKSKTTGDWSGCCRNCFLNKRDFKFDLNQQRYVTFADGTLLDLKHFFATMRLTHFAMVILGGRIQAVMFANAVGWLNEYRQYKRAQETGHPLGTNEDLFSNCAGTLFAALFAADYDEKQWHRQAVRTMELIYGRARHIAKTKQRTRLQRR